MVTRASQAVSLSTVARPMPEVPPITSADLPLRSAVIIAADSRWQSRLEQAVTVVGQILLAFVVQRLGIGADRKGGLALPPLVQVALLLRGGIQLRLAGRQPGTLEVDGG